MASLADSLWHRNRVLAEAALEHTFVQGIASGELARAAFAYYVGQDAAFLDAFCRAYALALAKSPDQDGLIAFRELLDAAADELRLHQRLRGPLGRRPSPSGRPRHLGVYQLLVGGRCAGAGWPHRGGDDAVHAALRLPRPAAGRLRQNPTVPIASG